MQRILIIEDDKKIALAVCLRLKAHGFATWIANDVISGLNKAMHCKPDLIIMDIALPGGNGLELARHLQTTPETHSIPIVFATASREPRVREKALQCGAVGLLRKPYEPESLVALVKHALAPDSLRFPAVPSHPQALDSRKTRAVKKILIVEDDEKVAMALAVRMKSAGYDTLIANDGLSGVQAAFRDYPDAIVLDISLPGGDGFSVAERVQAHLPVPMPIIFLTGSKLSELRQRALDLGAVAFFEKPYEAEGVLAAVRQATT